MTQLLYARISSRLSTSGRVRIRTAYFVPKETMVPNQVANLSWGLLFSARKRAACELGRRFPDVRRRTQKVIFANILRKESKTGAVNEALLAGAEGICSSCCIDCVFTANETLQLLNGIDTWIPSSARSWIGCFVLRHSAIVVKICPANRAKGDEMSLVLKRLRWESTNTPPWLASKIKFQQYATESLSTTAAACRKTGRQTEKGQRKKAARGGNGGGGIFPQITSRRAACRSLTCSACEAH